MDRLSPYADRPLINALPEEIRDMRTFAGSIGLDVVTKVGTMNILVTFVTGGISKKIIYSNIFAMISYQDPVVIEKQIKADIEVLRAALGITDEKMLALPEVGIIDRYWKMIQSIEGGFIVNRLLTYQLRTFVLHKIRNIIIRAQYEKDSSRNKCKCTFLEEAEHLYRKSAEKFIFEFDAEFEFKSPFGQTFENQLIIQNYCRVLLPLIGAPFLKMRVNYVLNELIGYIGIIVDDDPTCSAIIGAQFQPFIKHLSPCERALIDVFEMTITHKKENDYFNIRRSPGIKGVSVYFVEEAAEKMRKRFRPL